MEPVSTTSMGNLGPKISKKKRFAINWSTILVLHRLLTLWAQIRSTVMISLDNDIHYASFDNNYYASSSTFQINCDYCSVQNIWLP